MDCTHRELSKFSSECRIWLEKSLSVEDRADSGVVWASIRAVIDDEWNAILSRDQKISEKGFELNGCLLETMELLHLVMNSAD